MAATKWPVKKIARSSDDLDSSFPDYEVVKQKLFNQTAIDSNNNKFFSLELNKCSNGKFRLLAPLSFSVSFYSLAKTS